MSKYTSTISIEKLSQEIQDFIKTIPSTQENVERLVRVQIDEFYNSSVPNMINKFNKKDKNV